MFLLVPFKKLLKIIYSRFTYRRERIPASLHESLDVAPERRSTWRRHFIILLFAPIFYFIYTGAMSRRSGAAFQNYNTFKPSKYDIKVNINTNYSRNIYLDYEPTKEPPNAVKIKTRGTQQKLDTETQHYQQQLPTCEVPDTREGVTIEDNPNHKNSPSNTLFVKVKMGGYFSPRDCHPRHKVGILVPFRDRDRNLAVFLFNIHPFLMKQKLEYRIFVVEQTGDDIFNKGRLYNAGFKEAMKFHKWQCIIFHDVDLLPLNEGILYSCPNFPRHMCGTVIQKEKVPHYRALFGGVTAFLPQHFKKINGFSNMYWGWGGEDNDMFWRVRSSGLPVVRYNKTVARYTALSHKMRAPNPHRYKLLSSAIDRRKIDGLSNVKYNVTSIKLFHLYTHILIDINPDRNNVSTFFGGF